MEKQILRLKEVKEITSCSKSFIYHNMRYGKFPGQIKLGARAVGWYRRDIDEWINNRERIGS